MGAVGEETNYDLTMRMNRYTTGRSQNYPMSIAISSTYKHTAMLPPNWLWTVSNEANSHVLGVRA